MGKFYTIDPETCSEEELKNAIEYCANQEEYYHTMEQAAKIYINSIYGAVGAQKLYSLSNQNVAESITLQGQHLIKFSVKKINQYFRDIWQGDENAHRVVAEYIKNRHPEFDVDKFLDDAKNKTIEFETLQVYGDTDSAYMTLQPHVEAYDIPLECQTDFILGMHSCILDDYMKDCFDKYAAAFNCPENKQVLELEKTARTVIMLAKKNYFMDISWTDAGAYLEPLHKMVIKGFDVVKGVTPQFCRDCMMDFIKSVMSELNQGHKIDYDYLIEKIQGYKKKFMYQSPNDISKSVKISEYNKFIMNDKNPEGIVYNYDADRGKSITCPIHVRAAAVYNNMLYNKANKYKSKYGFVKSGDKIKFYYCKGTDRDGRENVFGFIPNEFPGEFAPQMDFDKQFEKMILQPLNRIVVALGFREIDTSFSYSSALF